ncbi:MAG: hypothetical protein WBO95_08585 [Candidatus Dechloromonas phosphoritropha]|jgi:fructose-specific component phosphotransferase system IIB-like protein
MLAISIPFLEKFACVVADKIIGLSRHPDYFEYHYRLNDLKKIRIEGLTKFVQVDGQGQVKSILLAEALRAKDTKAAVLPTDSLNDEEMAVVLSAIELVNQPEENAATPIAAVEAESQAEVTEAEPTSIPVTQASAAKRTKKKPRSKPARRATTSTVSD